MKMEDLRKTNYGVFFTLNYIYRRRNFNQSQWLVKEFNGNLIPAMEQLQSLIDNCDVSFIEKVDVFWKNYPRCSCILCEDIHRVNLPWYAYGAKQLPPYQLLGSLEGF
jgi:hypothetical protein